MLDFHVAEKQKEQMWKTETRSPAASNCFLCPPSLTDYPSSPPSCSASPQIVHYILFRLTWRIYPAPFSPFWCMYLVDLMVNLSQLLIHNCMEKINVIAGRWVGTEGRGLPAACVWTERSFVDVFSDVTISGKTRQPLLPTCVTCFCSHAAPTGMTRMTLLRKHLKCRAGRVTGRYVNYM